MDQPCQVIQLNAPRDEDNWEFVRRNFLEPTLVARKAFLILCIDHHNFHHLPFLTPEAQAPNFLSYSGFYGIGQDSEGNSFGNDVEVILSKGRENT